MSYPCAFANIYRGFPIENRYVVTLGRRVMIAWSVVAATRARRKAGAALLAASLSSILRRKACRRWASQAASAAVEAEQTMAALEHCYDGCLHSHLCAWLTLTKERRLLRRGLELLVRDHRAVLVSTGFRLWQRAAVRVRETVLRNHRVKVSGRLRTGGRFVRPSICLR